MQMEEDAYMSNSLICFCTGTSSNQNPSSLLFSIFCLCLLCYDLSAVKMDECVFQMILLPDQVAAYKSTFNAISMYTETSKTFKPKVNDSDLYRHVQRKHLLMTKKKERNGGTPGVLTDPQVGGWRGGWCC